VSVLRSFGRVLVVACLVSVVLGAWAQTSAVAGDDVRARRDEVAEELAQLEALLAPPGMIYALDHADLADRARTTGPEWMLAVHWMTPEEAATRMLEWSAGSDPDVVAENLRAMLAWHLRLARGIEARVAAHRAELAALDLLIADARLLEPSPSTFDWDLTGSWSAELDEGWELANLDDLRATLTVPSLAQHDLPTLTLRIENFHFVPGWNATISLRPRVRDVQAMLDGGGLHTIYPVGEFDGPLGPRSLAPEDTEPADREDHHCEAWDESGGIGRITVVDPGGPDERLELTLRFEAAHCDDGVPVEVFLTFRR
jgi:hypothetical protein